MAIVLSLLAVVVGALIARWTATNIAALHSRQRRHDLSLDLAEQYGSIVIEAASAVQAYVWWGNRKVMAAQVIGIADWQDGERSIQPAMDAVARLTFFERLLPEDMRELHREFATAMDQTLKVPTEEDARTANDFWNDLVDEPQPDVVVRAIEAATSWRAMLVETYPTKVPWRLRASNETA
ncbi:hypothetical protein [Gordonia sp. SND2]|uniref:hypothetical protein n=1 Tax=Gordonia sp. SND2 TaxID=3388659 RepID=UPI00398B3B99